MWLVQLVSVARVTGWDPHTRWMTLFHNEGAARVHAESYRDGWHVELWNLGDLVGTSVSCFRSIPHGLVGIWENGTELSYPEAGR